LLLILGGKYRNALVQRGRDSLACGSHINVI